MSVHTFSSADLTRHVAAAKRAAATGPLIITHRGRPAFALLKIEQYHQLAAPRAASLLDAMDAIPGGSGIEFDAPPIMIAFPS